MRINLASWNINGIRAAIKKDFWRVVPNLDLDIFCLQEIKAGSEIITNLDKILDFSPFQLASHSATIKSGYSGVATFSLAKSPNDNLLQDQPKLTLVNQQVGLGIEKFDVEGRCVITSYQTNANDSFTLINAYYPQGGRGQFRIDYKIEFYSAVLDLALKLQKAGHKIIFCGDLNTTVSDIDLARPKENRKTTGCLPEERLALNQFFEAGFVDSFRYFHPEATDKYTYWDQITRARDRNVGWRIDYFLVDKNLLNNLVEAKIHDDIMGSDHCPVSITLNFPS